VRSTLSPTTGNGRSISPNPAYYVYRHRNSGSSGGAKRSLLYVLVPIKPHGSIPGVGLKVDEVFLRDNIDAHAEGEDSSCKSTSPSPSRLGSSSIKSSQTRNSPLLFEDVYSYSYPSRNFGVDAGSIRLRGPTSSLYSDYHRFVEEYGYDYDRLTPPRKGGEARVRSMDVYTCSDPGQQIFTSHTIKFLLIRFRILFISFPRPSFRSSL
jgi:hypothetical protein